MAFLILYGSWFPFHWIRPDPEDVEWALTNTSLWTGRADLVGNVVLFLPWGLAVAAAARACGARPWTWGLAGGVLLGLVGQMGQFFEAHRDPRWADVVWNGIGSAAGLAIWPWLARWRGRQETVLLVGSALVAWVPLWPSFDPIRLQAHWAALGQLGPWQGPEAAMMTGLGLVAGAAAAARWPARAARAAVLAGAGLVAGQLLIPGTRLSGFGVMGLALGTLLALVLRGRTAATAWALVASQAVGALLPLQFQPTPGPFHWLPFEAMLSGGMLGNAQALARDLWLWGCALAFGLRAGWPVRPATLACATLVAALEGLQCLMPSRTADLTPALLVLGLGVLLSKRQALAALLRRR